MRKEQHNKKGCLEYFETMDIKILKYFLGVAVIIMLANSIRSLVTSSPLIYPILTSFVMLLVACLFFRNKNYKVASLILTWTFMLTVIAIYLLRPEVMSPVLLWCCITPLVLVVIGGLRCGIVQSLLMIIAIASIAYIKKYHGFSLALTHEGRVESDYLVNLIVVPICASCLAAIFYFYKKQTLETISQQNETLSTALLEKQKLVAILYHDFSNLISSISLRMELADFKYKAGDKDYMDNVNKARQAIEVMRDLILQIKKLEGHKDGKIPFILEPTSPLELCHKLEIIFAEQLQEKNIKFDYSSVEDSMIMADPVSLLSCVLSNLLSNSIKFSEEGATITLESKKQDGKLAIICRDTGIGIPEDRLNVLFSMSKKTSTPGTKGEIGSGYGLPVAKEIVEMHKGKIIVTSNTEGDDRGTTATVILTAA